jgi:hypothetical protein
MAERKTVSGFEEKRYARPYPSGWRDNIISVEIFDFKNQ